MGDRFIITVLCPKCGAKHLDVYYAPTCGFTDYECENPACDEVIDLAKYTGISYEDASNYAEMEAIAAAAGQASGDDGGRSQSSER